MTTKQVYQAITAVQAALAKEGISKSRNNAQQGYKFRGIDDVYNALSPLLAAHKLCILPRVLSRECTERQTKNGSPLFYSVVDVEFDFVSAEDGSLHTIRTFGEAMDSADKSTNKAMSAAYKYAAMQAFAIPTEGDNDADATTPDVAPAKPEPASKPQQSRSAVQSDAVSQDEAEKFVVEFKAWVDDTNDAEKIKQVWGEEEGRRKACGVTKEQNEAMLAYAKSRIAVLKNPVLAA